MNTPPKKPRGFTLLELLVVLLIIALLAGYVGPKLFSQIDKAKVDTATAQMKTLADTLNIYRLDVGRYPSESEGLEALVVRPNNVPNWRGPYLAKGVPLDPWGHPYTWRNPGENNSVEIVSTGGASTGDETTTIIYGF